MAGILKVDRVQSDSNLAFQVAGSNVAYMNSTGLQMTGSQLSLGGATIIPGVGQIAFPANQNASADANTLDDYEEGTWTPVWLGVGGTNPTVTYTGQWGSYTKIGNRVFWEVVIVTSAASGGSGTLAFSLPFQTSGGGNNWHSCVVAYSTSLTTVTKTGYTDPSRTDMFLSNAAAGGGNHAVSVLTGAGNGYLMAQGHYLAA